jgi:hypothetical protein
MDWEAVDLTLEGHIGGEQHPNMPWHMRSRGSDLYMSIFGEDRNHTLRIVHEMDLSQEEPIIRTRKWTNEDDINCNKYYDMFGSWPEWAKEELGRQTFGYAMMGGDNCDRCGKLTNLLTRKSGLCDQCDDEMNMILDRNPQVAFAWQHGF